MKRQAPDWEKSFAKHISEKALVSEKNKKDSYKKKGLVSRIHKELLKLDINKTNQLKNGQMIWTDTSPKKTRRWQISI